MQWDNIFFPALLGERVEALANTSDDSVQQKQLQCSNMQDDRYILFTYIG